ncbi:hypothetical protein BDY21DRAFT_385463 [Lineolata rhizophorae]|uniref:Gfo/Idh/MocA-like oxidoreductase N-terminal domain-containing protein n=1 Tax=Lineolata rhizophorae TaxID=578093 RepID=A0A6A6P1Q6_9PEZI|nr:hypothetical protein BDY21DRAFT_385463 [Lineolata rhizophorae]
MTAVLRVGIIGCGEISQVAHIPNINFLSDKFRTTYLCDVSGQALTRCAAKVAPAPPKTTIDAEELCASDHVDVVLIANANAYHVPHAILALKHGKHCFVEKPVALCYRDIDRLIEAEKTSTGMVFVGYMRRYATAFLEACKEVGDMPRISYARVRDIVGPNSVFVEQSGTFPKKWTDIKEGDASELTQRDAEIASQALDREFGVELTPQSQAMLGLLGSLGSHDLSAMREIIGKPKAVLGASLDPPNMWTILFQFDGFAVTYESGINDVPVFDAHIEVYSPTKIVRVDYDTPYVKGLPITMTAREKVDGRPGAGSNGYQERVVRRTYEDAYTLEMLELYDCITKGATPKTTAYDAKNDIDIFRMILQAGEHNYA